MCKFCGDEIIKRKQETNSAILLLPYFRKGSLRRGEFQWTENVSQQCSKHFSEMVMGKQSILPSGSCPPPPPSLTAAQCLLFLLATCFPSKSSSCKTQSFQNSHYTFGNSKATLQTPLIVLYSNPTVCCFCCLEGW